MSEADLRRLPSVDQVISDSRMGGFSHGVAVEAARMALHDARSNGESGNVLDSAVAIAESLARPNFVSTINCSGTILNTGLGRARLARAAQDAVAEAVRSGVSLEIDLQSGRRGDRQVALVSLLTRLTGAESAYVVNNNAGAVMLAVSSLASGGSVLLSRGQSVEIGGSFRMPDVVRAAGARLVDVGCTNKTNLSDYADAIDESTRLILRCHPSNFKMTGFVSEPSVEDLANLASEKGIAFVDDCGSGCLFETESLGLPHEPTLSDSVSSGADLVTASGDKLLGGPQAGILIGKTSAVEKLRKNPLARALRIDKMAAAALEATLQLYRDGKITEIPTFLALSRSLKEIEETARIVLEAVGNMGVVEDATCEPGGGSLPGVTLPSKRLGFQSNKPEELARRLRLGATPVVGYIEKNGFWLDMRTVETEDIEPLVESLKAALDVA